MLLLLNHKLAKEQVQPLVDVIKKSFANIPTVCVDEVRNINPVDLLAFRYIIFSQPTESVAFLGGKIEKSNK